MADINTRPYSKNYSGLVNQSVIALCISGLCITWHEFGKRKRRGKVRGEGLGSVESWEFGYLYQGRSWAKNPSPPSPGGWPLSWIKQAIQFPEDKMLELRGIDATLYTRFLRGCLWFTTLHAFTTFLALFPVHVEFSDDSASSKSMTRASIASLVINRKGLSLLWIHICLLIYITLTWMATLYWICRGAFHMRGQKIEAIARRLQNETSERDSEYHPHPHPHPYWPFPPTVEKGENGLKARTVMVSNIPPSLRTDAELKEYFQFYMQRKVHVPSMGLPSSTQPGFLNKTFAFLFNRFRSIPTSSGGQSSTDEPKVDDQADHSDAHKPNIDRVVIARKMTELASLLERREEVLRRLETAHIKLAKKTLTAVKAAIDERSGAPSGMRNFSKNYFRRAPEAEKGEAGLAEERMELLIRTLSPYLSQFGLRGRRGTKLGSSVGFKHSFRKVRERSPQSSDSDSDAATTRVYPPTSHIGRRPRETIWEALLKVPRSHLHPYQPLVRLNVLFRGKTVPAIDYYTAKLKVLTDLVTENRSKAVTDYEAVSTAFVTFADPRDARRACKYLAVHPNNPLTCLVTMAPSVEDLDWIRLMKSQFKVEFLKDWVVNIGVWAFTLFWLFPVSGLIGLVSIQNISAYWPGLKDYLDKHPWQEEVIQSFIPTLLVALLAILIPLILFLIAKKAHTITTLSAMHDIIMTRYYKFLIVNVLVFFCVGTAFVQTVVRALGAPNSQEILHQIATSFPTAGPFYVGWLIFTTAMHAGFELALLGLPLIMYPSTKRQVTPRKRALGIRPRTFNYYYWLPNHILVIHIFLLFSVFNPLVIPFCMMYFFIEIGVVKNQLLHVYAKNYEGDGQLLLIRMLRYSLDGLILTQAVFLAYMVVLKKKGNVGVAAVLIIFTATAKIFMTRMCRAQFEHDDLTEALLVCGVDRTVSRDASECAEEIPDRLTNREQSRLFGTFRRPAWLSFSYSTIRPHYPQRRRPNPFGPKMQNPQFSLLSTPSLNGKHAQKEANNGSQSISGLLGVDQTPRAALGTLQLPRVDSQSPVVPHAPPVPWDDQTHVDFHYDNPYYTRSIKDVLWLPRDPFAVLSLDDTVDLRRSITSEPSAGELGTWLGQAGPSGSPVPISHSSSSLSPAHQRLPSFPVHQFLGDEEIELPPGIARRVQSLHNENDVEDANERRPSFWKRKSSGSDWRSFSNGSRVQVQRPSTYSPGGPFRSLSAGQRLPRSRSFFAGERPRQRSATELGTRPDLHAQADFVRSALSLASPQLPEAEVALPAPPRTLKTHEALEMEIQAEEAEALEERLKQEEEEAEAAEGRYLWWVPSWMFRPTPSP